MEVGKDYIVVRAIRSWRKRRWIALSMIGLATLLLVSTLGYYIYAAVARSQLKDLEYTVSPEDMLPSSTGAEVTPTPASSPSAAVPTAPPTAEALLSSSFRSLYPGKLLPSLYWDDPRWTDVTDDCQASYFEGFTSLDGSALPGEPGSLPAPTRIAMPAITLDSPIKALEILDLGDARAWETPKDIVGHIPETANAGERGNVYLFGHLQSPIKGEGSVFLNLPDIKDQLRKCGKVYLVLYNEEDTAYLYQVVRMEVVHEDDFALEPSSDAIVTLVTCVPRYVYDYRLLVTARLVGIKG